MLNEDVSDLFDRELVIEAAPESGQARIYSELARKIFEHVESKVPEPLEQQELRQWASKWADVLVAAELRSKSAESVRSDVTAVAALEAA